MVDKEIKGSAVVEGSTVGLIIGSPVGGALQPEEYTANTTISRIVVRFRH